MVGLYSGRYSYHFDPLAYIRFPGINVYVFFNSMECIKSEARVFVEGIRKCLENVAAWRVPSLVGALN